MKNIFILIVGFLFSLSLFSKNGIEIKSGKDLANAICINYFCYNNSEDLKILKNIIENNKDIDLGAKSITGMTSLMCASMLGESELVKIIFDEFNIDSYVIDAVDTNGMTALDYACTKNNIEIAGILIDNGANVNNISKGGITTLMLASAFSSKSIVKCLIDNGAIIKETDDLGYSPITWALKYNKYENLEYLSNLIIK
jgi:ankyrin repeat protein